MWNSQRCSVVLPVRNEVGNIRRLVDAIPNFIDEVIIIDGKSTDGSFELAQQISSVAKVVRQHYKGKGAALSLGFSLSTGNFVFVLDTDGSMDPEELELFAAALDSDANAVKGSRNKIGGGSEDITRFRNAGNNFLTWLTNRLYGSKISDITYGYWGFRKQTLLDLKLIEFDSKPPRKYSHRAMTYGQGFEIEALMLCRILRTNIALVEVPCFENVRWSGSSNLHAISDGLRTLRAILRERFRVTI